MKKWLKLLAPLLAMAAIESATAAPPLYQLIEPRPAKSAIPTWAPHFAAFDTVVGYSDLGHVFMHDSQTKRYAVLHPYQKGAKNYGEFKTVADFERAILKESSFQYLVLLKPHVEAIHRLKGPLAPGQVYIAKPYPFLGGSEKPDTYSKGNVWVFLELVAQMHGL